MSEEHTKCVTCGKPTATKCPLCQEPLHKKCGALSGFDAQPICGGCFLEMSAKEDIRREEQREALESAMHGEFYDGEF